MLSAHGIGVITTRDTDMNPSATSRAEAANRMPAAACILIHATATGSGVHLYTSSLGPTPVTRFMPWQTAQSGYVTQSLKLSSEIDSAFAHAEIPVTLGRTSLQPMDSFTCPAVAVEVAPLASGSTTKAAPISDIAYQRLDTRRPHCCHRRVAQRLETAAVISRAQRILFASAC